MARSPRSHHPRGDGCPFPQSNGGAAAAEPRPREDVLDTCVPSFVSAKGRSLPFSVAAASGDRATSGPPPPCPTLSKSPQLSGWAGWEARSLVFRGRGALREQSAQVTKDGTEPDDAEAGSAGRQRESTHSGPPRPFRHVPSPTPSEPLSKIRRLGEGRPEDADSVNPCSDARFQNPRYPVRPGVHLPCASDMQGPAGYLPQGEGPRSCPEELPEKEVSLHNFSARLWEGLVHFHVMRLTDSLFLWVGATPHLRNLAVAMCTRYDSIPLSTALLGDTSDTMSTGLAQRLARKTSKQVFVSYNLPNTSSSFELLVESRIKEEMQAFPEKF
ncbi:PREDICTED: LOW QUALITY PROTEIN: proteasome assembly chaperone 4 [Bison bison bison]|uniref:LOW QUALITY PROTEIN: proteasome assembly chaperone 4 n=1 Tax=Bison bison bison TaxID=43346 RepID=A0A6P3GXD7_BISBB|nr:PREDICTED: LOW QUALITY PROTEIN: proteasome assembly chaperone 4 [Bison bison bison]